MSLAQFTDFMLTSPPKTVTGAMQLINEMQRTSYFMAEFVQGRDASHVIQHGPECQDFIILDRPSTAQEYSPADDTDWINPQFMQRQALPWRFLMDHMAWTQFEVDQAIGTAYPSREQLRNAYKSLRHGKESGLMMSLANKFDDQLLCTPFGNDTEMAGATGRKPMGVSAWLTEVSTGLPAGWSSGTNVGNINPVTQRNWRNPVGFYDPQKPVQSNPAATNERQRDTPTVVNDSGSTAFTSGNPYKPQSPDSSVTVFNIFGAFDEMWSKLNFRAPLTLQGYAEDPGIRRQKILTSRAGQLLYKQALRSSNDTLAPSRQDPAYAHPAHSGVPVVDIEGLNNAAIYPAHSTTVDQRLTGGAADVIDISAISATQTESHPNTILQGPRFLFLNMNLIYPIFNGEHYLERLDIIKPERKPHSRVLPIDNWWQLWCQSRRRAGGWICPMPAA